MSDSENSSPRSLSALSHLGQDEPITVPTRRQARRARWQRPLLRVVLLVALVGLAITPVLVRRMAQGWHLPWLDHVPDFFLLHPLVVPLVLVAVFAVLVLLGTRRTRAGRRLRKINPWKWLGILTLVAFLAGATLFALAPASSVVDDDPFAPGPSPSSPGIPGVDG